MVYCETVFAVAVVVTVFFHDTGAIPFYRGTLVATVMHLHNGNIVPVVVVVMLHNGTLLLLLQLFSSCITVQLLLL